MAGCGVSAEVADGTAPVEPVARVHPAGVTSGPRSTEAVTRWLNDLCPGAAVTVTPVVDLTQRISVSAYEVPDRLRAQVEERDDGCQLPWCGRAGAFDVDHINPYRVAGDHPGGPPPPGQTNTDNLARLCRFHHRVKTHGDWRYERGLNGVLTGPHPSSGSTPSTRPAPTRADDRRGLLERYSLGDSVGPSVLSVSVLTVLLCSVSCGLMSSAGVSPLLQPVRNRTAPAPSTASPRCLVMLRPCPSLGGRTPSVRPAPGRRSPTRRGRPARRRGSGSRATQRAGPRAAAG